MNRQGFLLSSAIAVTLPSMEPVAAATPSAAFDLDVFNAWLSRSAAHRQCFGATERRGGAVLNQMRNSIRAYRTALNEPRGSMHAIAVLYAGNSISIAYNDQLWNELLIPVVSGSSDVGTLTPESGNPFSSTLAELSNDGSHFFVCNNALTEDARILGRMKQRSADDMYAFIAARLVPNAMIVPAGVMAINAAQEAHFTYVAA